MEEQTEQILLSTNPENYDHKCSSCGQWPHDCICEDDPED